MGTPRKPQPVKLIIGLLARDEKLFDAIEEFFIEKFGDIEYRSSTLLFNHTDYYTDEIGYPLKRKFITFRKLILPENIANIKITTNILEKKFAIQRGGSLCRQINIDPGYISDSKLVLATTKDYSHRIYINKGIYAEITLAWKKGGFQPLEWTYPDYRQRDYLEIFNTIRKAYVLELRKRAKN